MWNAKEDIINDSRFINRSRNSLNTCGDNIDAGKLTQLVATAAIVLESLDAASHCNPIVTSLRSQVEELKKDLSAKTLQLECISLFLNEMNAATEQKKHSLLKDKTSTSNPIGSFSSTASYGLTSLNEKEKSRDADMISGERIYTLLQQQKVT